VTVSFPVTRTVEIDSEGHWIKIEDVELEAHDGEITSCEFKDHNVRTFEQIGEDKGVWHVRSVGSRMPDGERECVRRWIIATVDAADIERESLVRRRDYNRELDAEARENQT
jgi:hypothetical protein